MVRVSARIKLESENKKWNSVQTSKPSKLTISIVISIFKSQDETICLAEFSSMLTVKGCFYHYNEHQQF